MTVMYRALFLDKSWKLEAIKLRGGNPPALLSAGFKRARRAQGRFLLF